MLRPRLFAPLLVFLALALAGRAQDLYHQAYGTLGDPAIVFIHGGPGYNSASFEIADAQELAAKGFYVVVYDQRGCGRSVGMKADYTFEEAEKDLDKVYKAHKLKEALLIGHSFGGAVALQYATHQPEKVRSIVLVGAPMDYPATFATIRARCRAHYEAENSPSIGYIDILDTMDRSRLDYATYCFSHAMACGLYKAEAPTEDAKALYRSMLQDERAKYLTMSTIPPVKGFYASHRYTTQDHTPMLSALIARGEVPVYGIYGAEDGLFDANTLAALEAVIGKPRFHVVEGASHGVFVDRREVFNQLILDIAAEVNTTKE